MTNRLLSFDKLENVLSGQEQESAAANRKDILAAKAVLRQAVDQELTPRQRECVKLYFFHGLTQEETALALGVEKSTVCRHLQKAKKRLGRAVSYSKTAYRALARLEDL